MVEPQSIVHWLPNKESQNCGYCKNSCGSVQYGMWAQTLTVEDYQNLIDRGWRRSGQYCYKPIMDETCCPSYTIRCNALDFHPSKSQKKVMKRMNKFLTTGVFKEREQINTEDQEGQEEGVMDNYKECPNKQVDLKSVNLMEGEKELAEQNIETNKESFGGIQLNVQKENSASSSFQDDKSCSSNHCASPSKSKPVKKGLGADPKKPPCKKAKLMRLEKKMKKLENLGQIQDQKTKNQQGKSFEEFMNEISVNDKYKLTTKLIEPTNLSSEWKKYEQLEFELFRKYQTIIHNDPPHKNKLESFLRFLVSTPLQRQKPRDSPKSSDGPAYGSYHQQYWLDDKLIAVGVLDILPKCVSAVYFFYDPDYRELTLGTFGALKEIQLSRQLFPTLGTQFYYMGFYIHTCTKMRYKGNMHPSFLLCPETYVWFPIESCLPKLEKFKYCRFNEDLDAIDSNECTSHYLDCIKIIVEERFMTYKKYKRYFNREEVFINIGKLVGKSCALNMFFIES